MSASNPSSLASPNRRVGQLIATVLCAMALLLPASSAMAAGQPSRHKGTAHRQIILQHHRHAGAHRDIILQHHHH